MWWKNIVSNVHSTVIIPPNDSNTTNTLIGSFLLIHMTRWLFFQSFITHNWALIKLFLVKNTCCSDVIITKMHQSGSQRCTSHQNEVKYLSMKELWFTLYQVKNNHLTKSQFRLGGYDMIWIKLNHMSILLHQNPDLVTDINRSIIDSLTTRICFKVWKQCSINGFVFPIEGVFQ